MAGNIFQTASEILFWIGFALWYRFFGKGKKLPPLPPLPDPIPEDAPLSEEAKPFRFQRSPDNPNALIRRLWGAELFYWVFAKWTNNGADTVCVMHFLAPGVDVRKYARSAWLRTRYEAPLLGGKIVKGALPKLAKHLPYWYYDVPRNYADASQWAETTFQFVEQQEGKDDLQVIDELRLDLLSTKVSDDYPAMCYVYVGKERNTFIYHFGHFVSDGASAMSVTNLFWQALADSADVDLNEEVRNLPWGSEAENLPPTVCDAMGLGPTVKDTQVMLQLVAPIVEGHLPSLTLLPQRTQRTGRDGTCTIMQLRMDQTESKQIYSAMKARGFALSHAFDAARHAAVYFIRAKEAEETGKPLKPTHMVNFLSPIDCRRFFRGKHKGKPYVTVGTAAFNTEVPIADLGREPGQSDQDWQQAVFTKCLSVLAPQYLAAANDWRLIKGVAGGATLLGCEKPAEPQGKVDVSDAYTSIGLLESKLKLDYVGKSGEKVLTFLDFTHSPRQTGNQMCLHSWNVRGETILSANYNDCYDAEYTKMFLETMAGVLREAVRRGSATDAAREMATPAEVGAANIEAAKKVELTPETRQDIEQAAPVALAEAAL
ncbi:unnamed protein product [Tilletia controversa]|uniref:Uncharacterized protein n=3 Tax=Tilletia TaxID=13289 RepID=A0A8X7MS55_9BASI|nr:hypothetical protein CF336_g2834 [Tilletia laevis]KAE8204218.1 hypothetical protein CF328_g1212 [Tilletia controversa]KAE8263449.1 hypothetical protein A4X03_0g1671 [Tilletia caries]KAE8205946.1 hypothetical protein CF335_g2131 [Tilletia laevis]KAE8247386.1 hypothetical protein A4X06_0g4498 [Tilletia controversa]